MAAFRVKRNCPLGPAPGAKARTVLSRLRGSEEPLFHVIRTGERTSRDVSVGRSKEVADHKFLMTFRTHPVCAVGESDTMACVLRFEQLQPQIAPVYRSNIQWGSSEERLSHAQFVRRLEHCPTSSTDHCAAIAAGQRIRNLGGAFRTIEGLGF